MADAGRALDPGGAHDVLLRSRRFTPPADRRSALDAARRRGLDPIFHGLVQLDDVPSGAARADLAAAGIRLMDYLPRRTWRAAIRTQLDPGDSRLSAVRSIVLLDAADKIDPPLLAKAEAQPAAILGVLVRFHEDVPEATWTRAVAAGGGEIAGRIASLSALAVKLPARSVAGLAAEDAVAWIEEAPPLLGPANDGVRADLGIEGLWTDPILGLRGEGIDVLVFDQGRVDETHDDLAGRVVVGDAVAVVSHSTHVAGTLAGNGARSGGQYAGAAPAARVISYALGGFNAGIFLYSNPGDLEANFASAIQTYGADLANVSLGSNVRTNNYPCSIVGDYGVTDALLDAIVTGSLGPLFPIVVAGGNERPNPRCGLSYATTSPPAGAKNVLSIGALNSDDDTMTSFSAWGPTDDGRMKPDLASPGCQTGGDHTITSTVPVDTYGGFCGTSQASPAVTGVLAMLLQDSRARGMPDPPPAALRALAYHTALDLGNPGPDYQFGFGKLRPRQALDALRAGAVRLDAVAHGESRVIPVVVTDPNAPFVATLVWDDPPASAGAAVALVNDLDLKVFDPSGARRFPWTLDPAAPSLPAVRSGEDHRNNVEQVAVEAAGSTGAWRVEVAGAVVGVGATQPYALIISSGPAATPADGFVMTDRRRYRCGDDVVIRLSDGDLAGAGSTDVTFATTTEPSGVTVPLLEQATPGQFEGSVTLGGLIQTGHGDQITISHPLAGSAVATVDCVAPTLTGAAITMLDSRSARVTWLTDEPADTRVSGAVVSFALTTQHSAQLQGLTPCTGYSVPIGSADEAGNTTNAPPIPFETMGERIHFQDNLESGAPGWQNPSKGGGGSITQWVLTSTAYASPVRAWTDSAGGDYRDNSDNVLIAPPLDLTHARSVRLRFNHRYAIEEGFDFGYVEYSLDGSTWSAPFASFSGITQGFVPSQVPLPAAVENLPSVWLRFRLVTDNSLSFDGWYIDDVSVASMVDCSEVEGLDVLTEQTAGAPRVVWTPSPAAFAYNVYRGTLPVTAAYGQCLAPGVTGTMFDDLSADPALSYFYLVTGVGGAGEGTLGTDSTGAPRQWIPCP